MIAGPVNGFSKMTKIEKIDWLTENFLDANCEQSERFFQKFWHHDLGTQKIFDDFAENTISNFYFPYGLAPNFLINGKEYCVPMVIEESSVIAAASNAAKFWRQRGGFKASIISTIKIGQVHFSYYGEKSHLASFFKKSKQHLMEKVSAYTEKMVKRGGGLLDIELVNMTDYEPHYFQLKAKFETVDAMGANFINTVLEALAQNFKHMMANQTGLEDKHKQIEIIMAILSNYTPECLVRASVECLNSELAHPQANLSGEAFAKKFSKAIKIAELDVGRAVTHNKGIFNGIDAVVLATGNDFRAVEACGHAYASRSGRYKSLSHAIIDDDKFYFELEIPLSLGTVGGLTSLHPMAKKSLEVLQNPSAKELMCITASVGLAQNFAAVRSLITTGIQKGHMKMHLLNILNSLNVSPEEELLVKEHFKDQVISYASVRNFLESIRQAQ